jgi:uncharacterized MAPEG superfamily protein
MTEPQLLAATGLLAFALIVPSLLAVIQTGGLQVAFGNRENLPELPEWAKRANRAQRNMIDSLVPFLAIVIGVQMAGVSNESTQLGAALFFWGRVAHAVVYIAGIPYLRTLAFFVSATGLFLMAGQIVLLATP